MKHRKVYPYLDFVNQDERYGGPERATIADYRELNPAGHFEQHSNEIREYDDRGGYVVIARRRDAGQ